MSISSSLSTAISGLAAVTRTAEVISANIANATTPGYGKRDVVLAAQQNGGVRVENISRNVNEIAIHDRRLADASLGSSSASVDFFNQIEQSVGIPGDPGSLSTIVSEFEASLVAASASPESTTSLSVVLNQATQLTSKLNSISESIQVERTRADAKIARQVTDLNSSLKNIESLNEDIRRQYTAGGDIAGLIDQRQTEIDKIAELVPVRELPREFGQVALITTNGAVLVDDKAAEFSFTSTAFITPDMTIDSGALSGLGIEGTASIMGDALFAIDGGALSASFEVRDELTVNAQAQMDALSRNLIERFSGPTADNTLIAGQAGLFTDAGSDFVATDEVNVSSRISVNPVVVQSTGGDLAKIRDGIGSISAGPVGDATVLSSLRSALTEVQIPVSGNFSSAGSFSGLSADIISSFSSQRLDAESKQTQSATRVSALTDLEAQSGVSTDDELQKLLIVERAYAANAKVIQTVDEMIQSLLRI